MADAQELAEPSKNPIGKQELERLLLDAVRRGIEDENAPTLDQLPMATNDDQPAWPSFHFRRAGPAPKLITRSSRRMALARLREGQGCPNSPSLTFPRLWSVLTRMPGYGRGTVPITALQRRLPVTESIMLPPDVRDYIMGVFYRRRCPKCKAAMLARITPGSSGLGIRTLACPACGHVHQRVVDLADPMKSLKVAGWLQGECARQFRPLGDSRKAAGESGELRALG